MDAEAPRVSARHTKERQVDDLYRLQALLESEAAPRVMAAKELIAKWIEELLASGACVYCAAPKVSAGLQLQANPYPDHRHRED